MSKYHYTYRITNKVEQKHYYGARSSKVHPSQDLGIKYFSSSYDKEFKLEQKLNPENFKYKVIKIFETREEALALEIKLHSKFNVGMNESFYNKAKQTSVGFTYNLSEQERLKRSEKWKIKELNPNFYHSNAGENNPMYGSARFGELNPFFNKKHTDESKQKMSNSQKGKIHTDETRKKWSEQRKGIPKRRKCCPYCDKDIDVSNFNRHINRYHSSDSIE